MAYKPSWLKTDIDDEDKGYGWNYEGYKSGTNRIGLSPPPLKIKRNIKPMNYGLEGIDEEPKKQGFWEKIREGSIEDVPILRDIGKIFDKAYEIPFTQRIITSAGEAIAGAGAYKNKDGSVMRPKDTGSKIGNAVGDIVGTGLGMSVPLSGAGGSINKVTDKALMPLFNKLPQATSKAGQYGINALRTGTDFGIGNAVQGVAQGQDTKDVLRSGAEGFIQGAAFGTALKGIGDITKNAFPKWETTYESKIQPKSARNLTFKQDSKLVPQEGLLQLPSPRGTEVPLNVLKSGTEPITVGGYRDNIVPKVTIKKERTNFVPMGVRDFDNVGDRKIKAYQQNNPSVKPFIREEANILKGELKRTIPASRNSNYVNGERIGFGNQRITSDSIETIKAITGKSYKDIGKAIDNIIEDHGKENNALSKKIELIIDERLSNGYYDDLTGEKIPESSEYIFRKLQADETTPKIQNTKIYSGYENRRIPVTVEKPMSIIDVENLNKTMPIIDNTKVQPQYAREDIRKPLVTQPIKNSIEEVASTAEALRPLNNPLNKPLNNVEVIDDVSRPAQKVVSSGKDTKFNIKDAWNKFYTRMVDTSSPIKKVNDRTYTLATNSKNAGGIVDNILTGRLADREGNKINVSLKELAETLPKSKEDYANFWEYALQRHNINRAMEGNNVYPDFDSDMSAKAASKWEELHPEWKKRADDIVKWIDDFMQEWGVKTGVIDENLYKSLREKYPNYIPTNRAFDDIEEFISNRNGKGFVDQSVPLNRATGSNRDITDPLENIMNLVNRTVRTAKYNEVGQELLNAVRKSPQKLEGLAEIISENEVNPNVKNIVSVLENGKETYIRINDKQLLDAMQGIYKNGLDSTDNAVKKATNLYKSLITQRNPIFAVRNIARDIPTAYINGSEKNPLKFATDLVKSGKDLVTNSENAQRYKSVGGGGSNFFNSNKVAKSANELRTPSLGKKIGNAIENINNIVESAPRLAEFNRVLDKTGDVQKALFAANDVTTNFSRGGDVAKKIDAYVPYFNAGVQGLDKLARQFKNKPIPTAAKGLIGITSMTLFLDHINKDNPKYQELDNRTKDNYFLFPKEDGTFIKIPKSREYGVMFGNLFERALRSKRGDSNALKGFGNTVATNFSPTNIIENNILSPILNLKSNKDFANRTIVPQSMQALSPKYQYDEKTSEIAKKIGEKANISPKQIDYIIKSYTGVIGQLGLPATTKSNYNGNKKSNLLKPVTTQFIADPLYSNQTITDFYDNYDKAKRAAADKNFKENVSSKIVTSEEERRNGFANVSEILSAYSKAAAKASLEGNNDEARRIRAQMIQLAKYANEGNFPKGSFLKRLKENYK